MQSLFSQSPKEELQNYLSKYKDYPSVVTKLHTTYNMAVVENQIKVTSNQKEEAIILQNLGTMRNRESIHYSNFRDVQNIAAYTLIPESNNYKKIPVEKFDRKAFFSERNFHDDNKEIEFYYPNLEVGAKRSLNYDINYKDVNLLNGFTLYTGSPTEHAILEIITDKNIDVGYKEFNTNSLNIKFSKEVKEDKIILKWEAQNLLPFKTEEDMISPLNVIPHIEIYIKSYTVNGKKNNVLSNLDDLYKLYRFYLKDVNKTQDSELQAEVSKITNGINDEEAKVKAIFYWVKDHIKYISFEEGYDGFIPRNAKDIYKRKYGDCKDMTSILYQMIKMAGIENVYYTWVGSRRKPYSYYDVPTMIVDDHMIAVYKNPKNEYIYLDATSGLTPYGIPTSFIQGKECLIGKGETYEIVKIPVQSGQTNLISEQILLKLNGTSTLDGTSTTKFLGYNRDKAIDTFVDLSATKKLESGRELLRKGNNKFTLLHYDIKNRDDRDLPLIIDYQFKIDDYTITLDNEIFINLFVDKPLESTIINKDRVYGIEKDFNFMKDYTIAFEIPKGYKANYIPKNDQFSNPVLEYDVSYTVKDNKIELKYSVKTKKLIIKPDEFNAYNEAIKKLKENYSESISITKI